MKIAIVGANIRGLACASYLRRRNHEVDVFEKNTAPKKSEAGEKTFPPLAQVLEKIAARNGITILHNSQVVYVVLSGLDAPDCTTVVWFNHDLQSLFSKHYDYVLLAVNPATAAKLTGNAKLISAHLSCQKYG